MPETSAWVNPLPVRRVQRSADNPLGQHDWPVTLPSVAQLLREGLDLGPATVLVGENGTGKSTIVGAVAMAFGFNSEGSGLSFQAQLALVGALAALAGQRGTQVLVATHSPIIASLPGATILELDDDGYHQSAWADLAVVEHYARYLEAPERYLRHLVE